MIRSNTFLVACAVAACGCTNSTSTAPNGTTADAGTFDSPDGGSDAAAPSPDGGMDAGASCAPKTDYEIAVAEGVAGKGNYGHSAMVVDGNGQPMLAFLAYDPNGDSDEKDTTLSFVAYDRATCKWKAPVVVDVTGGVDSTRDRQVTLTRDPSTGNLGIGYQIVHADSPETAVMLAQSTDDGATWTKEVVATGDGNPQAVGRATVVMSGGKTYFAYLRTWDIASSASNASDADRFHLLTRSGAAGAFADAPVPGVDDGTLQGMEDGPPSLAVDAQGNAGLAFVAHTSDDSANLRVTYYKAGNAHSVGVFDSLKKQNDEWGVSLVFEGNKPRIAASLERGDADGDHSMVWFSKSEDGATWNAPVELPKDGAAGMGSDVCVAQNGQGQLSIGTRYGSSSGPSKCGGPKLSTSGDDGTTWTTCGPSSADGADGFFAGEDLILAYGPNGKRTMGWVGTDGPYKGIVVWREP